MHIGDKPRNISLQAGIHNTEIRDGILPDTQYYNLFDLLGLHWILAR